MKRFLSICLLILPFLSFSQDKAMCLTESVLSIGVYEPLNCGLILDKTRDFSDDNKVAEAVMDKTGISELGTGFIYEIKNRKYIITCQHVLFKSGRIVAFDSNYKEYELELVGSDMLFDLVVLKFANDDDTKHFKGLHLAKSFEEKEKTILKHIGFWEINGLANIKTGNYLSRNSESKHNLHLTQMGYFESTARIPGGFSGGPVVNSKDEVVGMNTARDRQGISYALNSNTITRLVHDIVTFGKVKRLFSGIEFAQDSINGSIFIQRIIDNSPASKKYKQLLNKEIIGINGKLVQNVYDILFILEEVQYSSPIRIKLKTGNTVNVETEYLSEKNLVKIVNHCLSHYYYPQFNRTEQENELTVMVEHENKYTIKTAGLSGNKVYCLSDLAQLGIIIRLFSPIGRIEISNDASHIYIKEIKFSDNNMTRVLYY